MALRIERFPDTEEARAAARRFNERLRASGMTDFELMESPFSKRYPESDDAAIWQQYFLALESDNSGATQEVRGGYLLQYQRYHTPEGIIPTAFLRLPLSEGVINKVHIPVGIRLMQDAMKREQHLCSLGMGGIKRPLPRLMAGLGWLVHEVPFHFLVLRSSRFFRQVRLLRSNKLRSIACDLLAYSGIGWAGTRVMQWRSLTSRLGPGLTTTCEPSFDSWADTVWEDRAPHYHFAGARNQHLLSTIYPVEDTRWIRCVVWEDKKPLGWALLLCTDWKGHKQFGSLRLGSIADCLAPPEHAAAIVTASVHVLKECGADLIVTNQTHQAWNAALKQAGFLSGPSNFVFAASPTLHKKFALGEHVHEIHINRGDSDGPINL